VGAGAGLDVLDEGLLFCFSQDLNPISSIVYPSYCTDCASPYWFEDNTNVCHNKVG
jgi:hypothetical protein